MKRFKSEAISSVVIALVVIVIILAASLAYLVVNPLQGTSTGASGTSTVTTTITSGGGGGGAGTKTVFSNTTVSSDLVSLAKAEGGSITVYSIIAPSTYNTYVLPNITKAYPWLKVNYVSLDPAGTISRPTSELKAGKVSADVVEIGSFARTFTDVSNGVCAPVNMSSYFTLEGFPAGSFDPAGRWYSWAVTPYVMIYNTQQVQPSQVPKSYSDLANPMWKGKIAIDKPSALGAAGLIFASLYPTMGNASWTAFMKNVAANQPALQASGGTVETLVGQGQYAIGFDSLNGALAAISSGLPLKIIYTNPIELGNAGGCITVGAPHPYTAQLYVQWETSVAEQIALTRSGLPSAIPAVTSYGLAGVVPSNVTFAGDVQKTSYYSNSTYWTNIFASFFGQ